MGAQKDVRDWLQPALKDLKTTDDKPWSERRTKFVEQLGLTDADQHPVAAELVRRLDELPDSDRASVLNSDRLDTVANEVVTELVSEQDSGDASGSGYDERGWQKFLTTNGPTWDGTAQSWSAFRQWFEYYATEQGFAAPAKALFEFLEAQSVSERVATFGSYGVVIAAPSSTATPGKAEPAGGFDWVTDQQAAGLTEIFGADWTARLTTELAKRWGPDWQSHPAEHKTAWLGDLIKSGALTPTDDAVLAELGALIDSIPNAESILEE